MVKFLNKKKIDFETVLLNILLLTSVDTILFGTNASLTLRYIPRIIGLLSSFVLLLIYIIDKKIKNPLLIFTFVFITLLFFASCANNKNEIQGVLSRFISILTGFLIALSINRKKFLRVFVSFVSFVCIIAILTELIAYIAPSIFGVFPIVSNSVGHQFRVFLIGSIEISELNNTLIRSNGIFWEPGAFAIYIIIALVFELFFFETINYKRVLTEIIGLFLTFSTTGYICLFALLFVFLLFKRSNQTAYKWYKPIIVATLLMSFGFIVFSSELLKEEVFGKIILKNSSAGSRFSSFFNGLAISFKYPLLGIGDKSSDIMKEYLSTINTWYSNGGVNINNTITGYMASYGIPFGSLLMLGNFLSLRQRNDNKLLFVFLCLIIMLAYCGERFFSFLPFALMFFGFKNDRLKETKQDTDISKYDKNRNYKYIR